MQAAFQPITKAHTAPVSGLRERPRRKRDWPVRESAIKLESVYEAKHWNMHFVRARVAGMVYRRACRQPAGLGIQLSGPTQRRRYKHAACRSSDGVSGSVPINYLDNLLRLRLLEIKEVGDVELERQDLPVDSTAPVWLNRLMMSGSENQFSLPRAALSTCDAQNTKFRAVGL